MDELSKLYEQGYQLYREAKYDLALEFFDEMLNIESDNLLALYGKSLVFNKKDMCKDALELLNYVIEQSGSNSDEMVAQKNYFISRVLQQAPTSKLAKSFETAIEIRADSTQEGIQKEKQFIAAVHGPYNFIGQSLRQHDELGVFDVLTIETQGGEEIDYFFDINNFFGIEFKDLE